MWRMGRDGREVWSWADYILRTYHRLFRDVAVRDLQHNSDHYMVLGPIMELCLAAERNPGMCLSRRWYEKPDLNIMDIRTGKVAAKGGEETGGG